MNPVTVGAVLLAIASGAAGEAGSKLWDAIATLARRPFGNRTKRTAESIASGAAELAALEAAPHDGERAVALAQALLARSDADSAFRQELEAWWAQTKLLSAGAGSVTNTITGGVHHGPVLQGRDFTNVSFGTPPSDGSLLRRGSPLTRSTSGSSPILGTETRRRRRLYPVRATRTPRRIRPLRTTCRPLAAGL